MVPGWSGPFSGLERDPLPKPEFGKKLPDGSVVLITFNDAMAVSSACDFLEAEGIGVDVRDVSEKNTTGGSFYGGPPVALEVIVPGKDRERSVAILREKMGLFPLQEVEEADELVDDGTVTTLGFFGRRGDAEAVAQALDQAKIWHRIVANAEGTVEEENAFSLEVREVDMAEAGDLVEKAMGLLKRFEVGCKGVGQSCGRLKGGRCGAARGAASGSFDCVNRRVRDSLRSG